MARVVGPLSLTPMVVLPPFSEKMACAPDPAVMNEPPRMVVKPAVLVNTACISTPCVDTEVSVRFATPPLAKLPKGPL